MNDEVEGWLIAWTVSAVALCLALGSVGVGYLMGFGTVTFKFFQLGGSLLAPLWLGLGLIQLLARKVPPKFAGWLFGIAFTIVSGVVLTFDPVSGVDEMGRSLPGIEGHWDVIPRYLLIGAHTIAGLIMLAALVVAGLRWRSGDEEDTDNLHAVLVIVPSGIALIGAMRFAVPGVFATALLAVAAAAIWYTVLRPLAPYEDEEEDEAPDRRAGDRRAPDRRGERTSPGRRAMRERDPFPESDPFYRPVAEMQQQGLPPQQPPMQPAQQPQMQSPMQPPNQPPTQPRRSGLGDLVAEYRAGDQQVDYAARMAPPPDEGPSTGYIMNGRHGAIPPGPQSGPQPGPHSGPHSGPHRSGPPHSAPTHPGPARPGMPQDHSMPATGAMYPGAEMFSTGSRGAVQQPQGQAQPASSRPSPNIYGMLTVFTLMDGSGEAFDRLAEATVEAVRRGEPDTLVYACHAVKSAPLQRIVYELYRDEVAYRDHQRQPHVERFVNERQSMVLATNIIELNVQAAKVVPLPSAMY
ncbi:putative quinol monooxygenase [Nonomuraea rhizosphaerae]|uniref:putative quinol monooxygenase n=1 Tax=Nonomuraea rhizosphaerae TaxID=2665663 RepID=UPI001C5F0E4C|nr:antibiotic biosynthesis monooxygenase [Nonomuraea rhizosphaerae]